VLPSSADFGAVTAPVHQACLAATGDSGTDISIRVAGGLLGEEGIDAVGFPGKYLEVTTMGPVQCPHCRIWNPPGAERCDCGYDFATATSPGSPSAKLHMRATILGWCARIAVFALVGGSLGYILVAPLRGDEWKYRVAFFTVLAIAYIAAQVVAQQVEKKTLGNAA
jgi:hypothetical protein